MAEQRPHVSVDRRVALDALADAARWYGVMVFDMEERGGKGRLGTEQYHHVGDDTGRVVFAALEAFGAHQAAVVFFAYLDSLNQRLRASGRSVVKTKAALSILNQALPYHASESQVDDIRDAIDLEDRHR